MNNNNNGGTSNNGEAIPKQQIPLQVVQQPVQYQANNQQQIVHQQGGCCGEGGGCACCLMKPASYKNGLYGIDFKMYHISFLVFSIINFYPETGLDSLELSYHGLYLPVIGLVLITISAIMGLYFGATMSSLNESVIKLSTVRGSLYIFGGLLYFLGYCIHAGTMPDDYDEYYWWWGDDIYPHPEYLVGRGIFVGFHAMFIGYLYIRENKLPHCCTQNGTERTQLIRFWSLLMLVYSILVLCYIVHIYIIIIYMALSPFILIVTLFLNCCLIKKSNEAGGCNSGASLGLLIVISYYFAMAWYVLWICTTRLGYWSNYEQPGWYVFYELGLFVFASMQLWILTRAMHPVASNCGCVQQGSGDGNVALTTRQIQQAAPSQVVMVVQQPKQQQQQPVVVATAAISNPTVVDDEDEKDLVIDEAVDNDEENDLIPTKTGGE